MKQIATIFMAAALAAGMFFIGRGCGGLPGGGNGRGGSGYAETRTDTLVVRDTLRDTVLIPVERLTVRVDTVWLTSPGDTVRLEVEVPIERRVYATADYRAVIEGFRPELVDMSVFRATTRITRETLLHPTPRRWSAGVQAGYGITPRGPVPYIGVGIQYTVLSW
jgi:hypothetical protein